MDPEAYESENEKLIEVFRESFLLESGGYQEGVVLQEYRGKSEYLGRVQGGLREG